MCADRLPVGQRLMPALFDEWVALEPKKVVAYLPTSKHMENFHGLTFAEYEKMVNSFAWFIEQKLGKCESADATVVSYMGVPDWRYPSFWVAAMKCGYCTLNPSIRNASEEHAALMEDTGCKKLFYSAELEAKAYSIKSLVKGDLELIPVPTLKALQSGPNAQRHFPFQKTFDEWAERRALCFHTSGTTGLPQPRFLTHAYFATMDRTAYLEPPPGRRQALWSLVKDEAFFHNFPAFHAGGCFLHLFLPLFVGAIPVPHSHEAPLTPEKFIAASKAMHLAGAFTVPSFLEDCATVPEAIEGLGKLKYLFFGAGPLTERVGQWLSERTNMIQNFGSTEAGMIPHLVQEDFRCVEWNPAFGCHMDEVEEGIFELTIQRDPVKEHLQSSFKVFPELQEWRTKDLFTRGDKVPNTWRFYGRKDQVIALSNGEKFSPVLVERHICEHPYVSTCMVAGQGRIQPALIVEPDYKVWDAARPAQEFIDDIWPYVQEANATTTGTGQIFRNRIVVTKPDKPFVRVDKGTVSRARTIKAFSEELDTVYADNEDKVVVALPEDINPESMKGFVRECLQVYYAEASSLTDSTDFFTANIDSLQTIGFVNVIRVSLKAQYGQKVDQQSPIAYRRMVYENPSIEKLATRLVTFVHNVIKSGAETNGVGHDAEPERQGKISALVDKYTANLDKKIDLPHHGNKLTVVLTGTTGSLGSYLLYDLCSNPRVVKVYCFNRREGAQGLAQDFWKEHGRKDGPLSKAEFHRTNFGDKDFGIGADKVREILDSTDIILHNAWAVNFNHVLESFEDPHLKGIRTFVDWGLQGSRHAQLFFVSTIGTGGEYPGPEAVPEVSFETCVNVSHGGYPESKHVAERILEISSDKTGLSVSFLRLGQVAGPTTQAGRWNEREWFPILLKSSKILRKIPDRLGGSFGDRVDWIPVDVAATVCMELAFDARDHHLEQRMNVFHLVNPQHNSWKELVPMVKKFYNAQNVPMDIVPYEEWVKHLKQAAGAGLDQHPFNKIPAIKLLEFFDALQYAPEAPVYATDETIKRSPTLARLEGIQPTLLEHYLKQLDY